MIFLKDVFKHSSRLDTINTWFTTEDYSYDTVKPIKSNLAKVSVDDDTIEELINELGISKDVRGELTGKREFANGIVHRYQDGYEEEFRRDTVYVVLFRENGSLLLYIDDEILSRLFIIN